MILIRRGNVSDVEAISAFDLVAVRDEKRRQFIQRSVASSTCYVAVYENEVIGYGVLSHTFYDNGFIEMLYVNSNHWRRGVATALLRHLESLCETPKLFTSTNRSNLAMQSLLVESGYELSGVIQNLDDGDPELVFYKLLRRVHS